DHSNPKRHPQQGHKNHQRRQQSSERKSERLLLPFQSTRPMRTLAAEMDKPEDAEQSPSCLKEGQSEDRRPRAQQQHEGVATDHEQASVQELRPHDSKTLARIRTLNDPLTLSVFGRREPPSRRRRNLLLFRDHCNLPVVRAEAFRLL